MFSVPEWPAEEIVLVVRHGISFVAYFNLSGQETVQQSVAALKPRFVLITFSDNIYKIQLSLPPLLGFRGSTSFLCPD